MLRFLRRLVDFAEVGLSKVADNTVQDSCELPWSGIQDVIEKIGHYRGCGIFLSSSCSGQFSFL